jgi:hypothetical protein
MMSQKAWIAASIISFRSQLEEMARDAPVSGHVMDPVGNIPLWKALEVTVLVRKSSR